MGAHEQPPPPPALGDAVAQEQPCEVCTQTVRLLVVRTPPGSPDLIRALFPDSAWLGWAINDEEAREVRILALCSRACLVEWFDLEHGPGV